MRIDIVTVFPQVIRAAASESIVGRAIQRGLAEVNAVDLRDYTTDRHRTTDDTPYGGGGGMIMKVEPIAAALRALGAQIPAPTEPGPGVPRVALMDPRGRPFNQELARAWSREPHLILVCGHYEGVDERVAQYFCTDSVSIGDFILTGGELPALAIADALVRLQPGALGEEGAHEKDTFTEPLLEYPHYTRPADFEGWRVPELLLNGHHANITRWRRWRQIDATRRLRPDLFARLEPTAADLKLMNEAEPRCEAAKNRDLAANRRPAEQLMDEENHGTGTSDNT